MPQLTKNWDHHVVQAEEIARTPGFCRLRDLILDKARPRPDATVLDIGAGTGLLTLPLARQAAQVWAVDISPAMGEYLRVKARSAGLDNIEVAVSSAVSLPLVDESVDVAVSNYCFHHLPDDGKDQALREVWRVLRPGGRVVFGDMMFRVGLAGDARDRQVVAAKVRAMMAKGPAGFARLAKNGARLAAGRWEQPAPAAWWEDALARHGFAEPRVEVLEHEGGVAWAIRP